MQQIERPGGVDKVLTRRVVSFTSLGLTAVLLSRALPADTIPFFTSEDVLVGDSLPGVERSEQDGDRKSSEQQRVVEACSAASTEGGLVGATRDRERERRRGSVLTQDDLRSLRTLGWSRMIKIGLKNQCYPRAHACLGAGGGSEGGARTHIHTHSRARS